MMGSSSTPRPEHRGPRLIVEVRSGRLRGKKALIPPGGALRIGSTARADLVVPGDDQMSGVHFELAWDGARCRLQDQRSHRGTLLNGAEEPGAEVADGDWIRAGETDFMVYVEGAVPARTLPEPEDPEAAAARAEEALAALRAEEEPLFAVLDAARDGRVLELLRAAPEEHLSLYDGARGETFTEEAPYLVGLPRGSWLLDRLVQEGWGRSWGVYLTCRRPLAEVRRHLRRFLVVEVEETQEALLFRFYDPRVLRVFLPTCTPKQAETFLGEFQTFFVEGDGGEILRLPAR